MYIGVQYNKSTKQNTVLSISSIINIEYTDCEPGLKFAGPCLLGQTDYQSDLKVLFQ